MHEKEKSTKADVVFMVKTNARGRNQGRRSEDVAAARRSKSIDRFDRYAHARQHQERLNKYSRSNCNPHPREGREGGRSANRSFELSSSGHSFSVGIHTRFDFQRDCVPRGKKLSHADL